MELTNEQRLPEFLVKAVEYWDRSYDSQADYSVTQLLDTPRRVALMRQHKDELVEDVSDRIYSLLGSSVHKVVESALIEDGGDNLIVEHRAFAELGGVRISGQCDVYDKSTATIYDLKTASVFEIINGVREEREQQLNAYAWLGRREGWQVDAIAAVFILRDWSKGKAAIEKDWPDSQVVVYPLPLWSDDDAERFLAERIRAHQGALTELPYCSPAEQWRRPDRYAVMSRGRKRAHRLLETHSKAHSWMTQWNKGDHIEERPGKAVRCEGYCSVNVHCSQYAALQMVTNKS